MNRRLQVKVAPSNRRHATACVVFLSLAVVHGACRGECISNLNFPSCADQFDKTTIYVHERSALTEPIHYVTDNPVLTLRGDSGLGTNWSGTVANNNVWLGFPDIATVAVLSYDALFECEGNTNWILENTAQLTDEVDLVIRPEQSSCTAAPLLLTQTETHDFGYELLPITTQTDLQWVWVGAPSAGARMGKVFLYQMDDAGLTPVAQWKGPEVNAQVGQQIRACGDVSGDGVDDILMSTTSISGHAGGVLLIPSEDFSNLNGDREAFDNRAGWLGAATADGTGASVWCEADVTGDVYADLLIGAPYNDGCGSDTSVKNCGVVYLVPGGPDLPPSGTLPVGNTPVFRGPTHHGFCGTAVTAGHFNDDSVLDIAIGCPGLADGEGKVLLYAGDPTTYHNAPFPQISRDLSGSPTLALYGEHFGTHLRATIDEQTQRSNLWVGTPARQDYEGRLQAGSIELWSNLLDNDQPATAPVFSVEGNESFQRVGSHFWGTDYLFVRTHTE